MRKRQRNKNSNMAEDVIESNRERKRIDQMSPEQAAAEREHKREQYQKDQTSVSNREKASFKSLILTSSRTCSHCGCTHLQSAGKKSCSYVLLLK